MKIRVSANGSLPGILIFLLRDHLSSRKEAVFEVVEHEFESQSESRLLTMRTSGKSPVLSFCLCKMQTLRGRGEDRVGSSVLGQQQPDTCRSMSAHSLTNPSHSCAHYT